MILTCPSCATRYQTDAAKFPPEGRQVRCAKCGHVWHQDAAVDEAPGIETPLPQTPPEAPVAVAAPVPARPEPMPRAPAPRATTPPKPRRPLLPLLGVALGWIGLIAVVLLIGLSAVRYRQEITVIWPQSAGVYSSLGMNVNAHGIDFTDVDYHRESEDGQVVLAVTGRIVNKGSRELPVPQNVRVTLSDASNHELYHWNFAPGIATLKAGQSGAFHTRLSNPPATARHLEVRFAKDDK
jgi:predicted Zn finger-like uncharacterized protein